MKNVIKEHGGHTVTGNIFEAIGFSAAEANTLAIKSDILSAIIEDVRKKGYTQKQLAELLDEHQPSVSNLLRGRIGQVSIEKLLRYADRLGLKASVAISVKASRRRTAPASGVAAARRTGRAVSVSA